MTEICMGQSGFCELLGLKIDIPSPEFHLFSSSKVIGKRGLFDTSRCLCPCRDKARYPNELEEAQ